MTGQIEGPISWVVRGFSVAKRPDTPNEDRWLCSSDGRFTAISDGASISYDPGPWADLLVKRFVEFPVLSREWLASAIESYASAYDRDSMPWMSQAAFDRGSFATLVGIAIDPTGAKLEATAVGDSILALVASGSLVAVMPYNSPDQFDAAPVLLSTSRFENKSAIALMTESHVIQLPEADVAILLMTDAIARWSLEESADQRLQRLASLSTDEEFSQLVEEERAAQRMRIDDTTLVIIRRP